MKCLIDKCAESATITIPYNGKMLPVCGLNHYMVHVEREAQEYVMSIVKQRREGKKNAVLPFHQHASLRIAK
jgi:hypothetical protein